MTELGSLVCSRINSDGPRTVLRRGLCMFIEEDLTSGGFVAMVGGGGHGIF